MSEINKTFHQEFMKHILPFPNFSFCPMIGGYIYYYQNVIIGGIYGEAKLFLKISKSSKDYFENERECSPYPGAKPMIPVTSINDYESFKQLIMKMANELPVKTKKKVDRNEKN